MKAPLATLGFADFMEAVIGAPMEPWQREMMRPQRPLRPFIQIGNPNRSRISLGQCEECGREMKVGCVLHAGKVRCLVCNEKDSS